MKLLAIVVLGVLFAVALSRADNDMKLTDEAVVRLHEELNVCDADAKTSGIPLHGECSSVQTKLADHYLNHDEYQLARKSNQ